MKQPLAVRPGAMPADHLALLLARMLAMMWLGGCAFCHAPDEPPQADIPTWDEWEECYLTPRNGPCYRGLPPPDVLYYMIRFPERWPYPYSVSPDVESILPK